MRIGALCSDPNGWHVQDLLRAARRRNVNLVPLDYRTLTAQVAPHDETILANGVDLRELDVVFVRAMPAGSLEQVVFRMDALHRLQERDIPVINPPRAIECAVDKYLALARLGALGLPVPRTVTCEQPDEALEHFRTLNDLGKGSGVVVKPLFGSEGHGIARIDQEDAARELFQELSERGSVFYLQEFIAHPGWDLRVLVFGEHVLACMRRRLNETNGDTEAEWRTNLALGGIAEAVELDEATKELALNASRAIGTEIAGVDLVPDEDGNLQIVEINAAPGWRGLTRACKLDIADRIVVFLETRSKTGGSNEA